MNRRNGPLLAIGLALSLARDAFAQTTLLGSPFRTAGEPAPAADTVSLRPEAWGISSDSVITLPALALAPVGSEATSDVGIGQTRLCTKLSKTLGSRLPAPGSRLPASAIGECET
jgi:hypothetical protein